MYKPFSLLGVFFVLIQSASAQPVAERVLPERGYLPGASVKVVLNVPDTAFVSTLIEIPPQGWKINNILSRYIDEAGFISMPLQARSKPRSIIYYVTPPSSAAGEYSFYGHIDGNATTGMTTVSPMVIEPIGIFENHIDLGNVAYSKTEYIRQSDEYRIEVGLTPNTPSNSHFVYREVFGDCSIQAHGKAQNDNPNYSFNSIVAVGIFDNLNFGSSWFGIETKATGDCWYGWGKGENLIKASQVARLPFHDGRMRIERHGDVMRAYYFDTELNEWTHAIEHTMEFEDPVYIGILAGCEYGNYNVGTFNDVVLTYESQTSVANWEIF